jgi:hypothetical protein
VVSAAADDVTSVSAADPASRGPAAFYHHALERGAGGAR